MLSIAFKVLGSIESGRVLKSRWLCASDECPMALSRARSESAQTSSSSSGMFGGVSTNLEQSLRFKGLGLRVLGLGFRV